MLGPDEPSLSVGLAFFTFSASDEKGYDAPDTGGDDCVGDVCVGRHHKSSDENEQSGSSHS